jgi:hypothetical protein
METDKAIQNLKSAIASARSKGRDSVPIEILNEFVEVHDGTSSATETQKLKHESDLEWYKAQRQSELEMFKSVIEAGQTALKTSFLINGGAAVALLAFIGNVWTKTQEAVVAQALATSVSYFSGGVLLGALATATTYLAQRLYSINKKQKGIVFDVSTLVLIASAYVAYGLGVSSAYDAFIKHLIQH